MNRANSLSCMFILFNLFIVITLFVAVNSLGKPASMTGSHVSISTVKPFKFTI